MGGLWWAAPRAGARGRRAEWRLCAGGKGVQSLVEQAPVPDGRGDHGKMRQVERQLPILALSDGFAVLTSTLPPVAPRGCLPAGPQTRRWDTVHGSSLALKWTWPCPDGAQSIPTLIAADVLLSFRVTAAFLNTNQVCDHLPLPACLPLI